MNRREVYIEDIEIPMESSILDEPNPLILELMHDVQEHRRDTIANDASICPTSIYLLYKKISMYKLVGVRAVKLPCMKYSQLRRFPFLF